MLQQKEIYGAWSFTREVLAQPFLQEGVSLVSFLWAVHPWGFPWGLVPEWKEQL